MNRNAAQSTRQSTSWAAPNESQGVESAPIGLVGFPFFHLSGAADIGAEPAFGPGHEFDQGFGRRAGKSAACRRHGIPQVLTAAKQRMIELFQLEALFRREVRPAQSHDIQAAEYVYSHGHGERRQIPADHRPA